MRHDRAFASRYMHRERGFNRFFVLYALFVLGMVVTSLAGTIETLFAGWELVGLSSALLVAFFQERPAPARNGLWVWVVYRVSDAALLLAAVVMHHLTGEGDFDSLLGGGPWPEGHATVTACRPWSVGLLLLVAAAGKSALVPFSGWLPRAMEGPTPSSAVFYGALSVHLGAFLLLRVSPLLESIDVVLCVLVVAAGADHRGATPTWPAACRPTSSRPCAFASLTQVGIIVAEIGLGFRYVALVHLLGHACLRTLQFVRAPTLLHDYHTLENALGGHLPRAGRSSGPAGERPHAHWIYRLALERGYLDSLLHTYFVAPVCAACSACATRLERRWTEFPDRAGLARVGDQVKPSLEPLKSCHEPDSCSLPWLESVDRDCAARRPGRQPAARALPLAWRWAWVHRARRSSARSWRGWAFISAGSPERTCTGACSLRFSAGACSIWTS